MASIVGSRRSSAYNPFDIIAEPGRRLEPLFLRRVKTRRSKTAILLSILCVLLLVWGWRGSGVGMKLSTSAYSTTQLADGTQIISADLASDGEAPLLAPPFIDENGTSHGLMKTSPSLHLLIPASDPNTKLCKTLLSAFVLGYPAPTLINWGQKYEEPEIGRVHPSHIAKIRGVYEFLNDPAKVKDDDLVMVIDGYDVWFQLPPQIMVARYHAMIREADELLKNRYGGLTDSKAEQDHVQKYSQKVIFGADKICWPNPTEDPACAAVPYSTLPKYAYGPDTDKDPEAFLNRPRFLNSGNVIGPVANVRAIYEYAVQKILVYNRGILGDQFVFAEIFGEQEFQRETQRIAAQGTTGRWMEWLASTLGRQESPFESANVTIHNMTVIPGQQYEFSIGLDYESRLFQTMTHSADDVQFMTYNSTSALSDTQNAHPSLGSSRPLFLPADLQTADLPYTYASPGNHSWETDPSKKTILLPYSTKLDTLPEDPTDAKQPTWSNLPLATNIHTASIPALLHINGDKSLLESWWPWLWYHPQARALLRRSIRSTQGAHAATSAAKGGLNWWDSRGGKGGVWTDHEQWMAWGDVCPAGTEEAVFEDGKGVFGKEENDGRVVNSFGKVLVGDDN